MTEIIQILTAISLFCAHDVTLTGAGTCDMRVWRCIEKERAKHNATPPVKECHPAGIAYGTLGITAVSNLSTTEYCTTTTVEKWEPEKFEDCFRYGK